MSDEQILENSPTLYEVYKETRRHLELWGEQNHPDATSQYTGVLAPTGEAIKNLWDSKRRINDMDWSVILIEELVEAIEEAEAIPVHEERLYQELVQVAAVSVSWAEAINRRHKDPTGEVEIVSDYLESTE